MASAFITIIHLSLMDTFAYFFFFFFSSHFSCVSFGVMGVKKSYTTQGSDEIGLVTVILVGIVLFSIFHLGFQRVSDYIPLAHIWSFVLFLYHRSLLSSLALSLAKTVVA